MHALFYHWRVLQRLLLVVSSLFVGKAVLLDCDPCIDRSGLRLAALLPSEQATTDTIQASLEQAAQELRVDLYIQVVEDTNKDEGGSPLSSSPYSQAIVSHANSASWDALIVTVPTTEPGHTDTVDALQEIRQEHPQLAIFGFGWGYRTAASFTFGWVASDQAAVGQLAAEGFIPLTLERNQTLSSGAFVYSPAVNNGNPNDDMAGPSRARWQVFVNTMATIAEAGATATTEVTALSFTEDDLSKLEALIRSCDRQALLLDDPSLLPTLLRLVDEANCAVPIQIGVILDDHTTLDNPVVYRSITRKQVAFALNPNIQLQATLAVQWAQLYVTTGKRLAMPIATRSYFSGPDLVDVRNVPSDTLASCEQQAFPVCEGDELAIDADFLGTGVDHDSCTCIQRRQIRLGGVFHGAVTHGFWDPIFASAEQAALDMDIELDMERFQPTETDELFHEQMAARIRNLCVGGVDGLFVSIPSETVKEAVLRCLDLGIPVVCVNSCVPDAQALGLLHYVGEDSYSGGYGSAIRMAAAGMTEGYCIDHKFGHAAGLARCRGFKDGIATLDGVEFMGHFPVPVDNAEQFVIDVNSAVARDDDWKGVGLLNAGADSIPDLLRVLEEHPGAVAATFDQSDLIYEAITDGRLLFGIDQQPLLQGNIPVYLLAYAVTTHQALTDFVIQTGPSFLEGPPTDEQRVCESNLFSVCPSKPEEDFSYISRGLRCLGYSMFSLLGASCVVALCWTYMNRDKFVVTASQPIFLALVSAGTLVSSLSIVFMGFQTSYRIDKDGHENPDVQSVDAACMAVPFLYGIGFVVTFSALFAKIHRIKLIHRAGQQMRRITVSVKDVLPVIVVVLIAELSILLAWLFVSPLQWEREVLDESDGFPTESAGSCDGGKQGWSFYIGMVAFHGLCLCYALILCFQTKNINSDFAESSYLSLSVAFMFQILVLAVPISALVHDKPDVFYFTRAAAVFLQNFSVMSLIFIPKIIRMKEEQMNPTSVRALSLATDSRSHRVKFSNSGSADHDLSDNVSSQGFTPALAALSGGSCNLSRISEQGTSTGFARDGKYLTREETLSNWQKIGFPSRNSAEQILALVERTTDAKTRKAIGAAILKQPPDSNTDGCTQTATATMEDAKEVTANVAAEPDCTTGRSDNGL